MSRARAMARVMLVGSALAPFGCVGVVGDFDVQPAGDGGSSDATIEGSAPGPDAKSDTTSDTSPGDAEESGADVIEPGSDAADAVSAADAADASDATGATDAADASDACPNAGSIQTCNGACVDESKDPANCGSCGFTCARLGSCVNSRCTCPPDHSLACPAPPDPNATCIDPNTDNANCNGCNIPCKGGLTCANAQCQCLAPLVTCPNGCVDTSSDPLNCGTCGHSCLGSTCANGLCAPTPLSGGFAGSPVGLIVDGANVTWTQTNSSQSSLMRCPLTGCNGTVLTMVSGMPDTTTLVQSGTRIYFANNGGGGSNTVERVNVDGTSPVAWVVAGNGESVAADGTMIYWSANGNLSRADGTLAGQPTAAQQFPVLSGFKPIGLASVSHQQMAFDANNVYLLDPGSGVPTADGRVLSCGKLTNCGANATALMTGIVSPRGIWQQGGQLYVTSSATGQAGGLWTCQAATCTTTWKQLASTPGAQGIFADANNVYWGTMNGTAGGVYSCPLAGCPAAGPNVVVTGATVLAVTVDASYVYYAASGGPAIWRVAK